MPYKDPNWFNRIINRNWAACTLTASKLNNFGVRQKPSLYGIAFVFSFFFIYSLFFCIFYFAFVLGQKRWETHLRMWQKISVNKLRENEADFNQFRAFSQFSGEASPEGFFGVSLWWFRFEKAVNGNAAEVILRIANWEYCLNCFWFFIVLYTCRKSCNRLPAPTKLIYVVK